MHTGSDEDIYLEGRVSAHAYDAWLSGVPKHQQTSSSHLSYIPRHLRLPFVLTTPPFMFSPTVIVLIHNRLTIEPNRVD